MIGCYTGPKPAAADEKTHARRIRNKEIAINNVLSEFRMNLGAYNCTTLFCLIENSLSTPFTLLSPFYLVSVTIIEGKKNTSSPRMTTVGKREHQISRIIEHSHMVALIPLGRTWIADILAHRNSQMTSENSKIVNNNLYRASVIFNKSFV